MNCTKWKKTHTPHTAKAKACIQDAIVALEFCCSNSKHNFQVKLLLARLYAHPLVSAMVARAGLRFLKIRTQISAVGRSAEFFNGMDVKQIQFEALLHLILPDLIR